MIAATILAAAILSAPHREIAPQYPNELSLRVIVTSDAQAVGMATAWGTSTWSTAFFCKSNLMGNLVCDLPVEWLGHPDRDHWRYGIKAYPEIPGGAKWTEAVYEADVTCVPAEEPGDCPIMIFPEGK